MSELSESQYRKKARLIIDSGVHDPDLIFQKLVQYYFKNDPDTDWFYDTQDDMEELFDGLADILAENFRNQPPGSPKETEDAKRFRKVRNWVENVNYNTNNRLVRAAAPTNPSKKFEARMDRLMHLLAGAAIAANLGETVSDGFSFAVEVGDEIKQGIRAVTNQPPSDGYDSQDFLWGKRGSFLQNAFDTSDSKARKLAAKFASGRFQLSGWHSWYKQPDSVLYQ